MGYLENFRIIRGLKKMIRGGMIIIIRDLEKMSTIIYLKEMVFSAFLWL